MIYLLLILIIALFTGIYLRLSLTPLFKQHKQDRISKYIALVPKGFVTALILILLVSIFIFWADGLLQENERFPTSFSIAFNGILGPLVALVAAGLTFAAFWVQYEANQQQIKANKKQQDDIRVERFEYQFYEMLRFHRDNVMEMDIAGIQSRKAFMRMFYEFKYLYYSLEHSYYACREKLSENYGLENLTKLAYKSFFHGIGGASNNSIFSLMDTDDQKIFAHRRKILFRNQDKFEANGSELEVFKIKPYGQNEQHLLEVFYYPFDGHESRLGHYYRHLYQMVKYVLGFDEIDEDQKYSYLKMIRGQLSNFEQLLLYYNSFAYGKVWIDENLFSRWKMIKNISLELSDFGVNPKEMLLSANSNTVYDDNGTLKLRIDNSHVFEWEETSNSL